MRRTALVLAGVLATGFALTAAPEAARAQGLSVSFGYGSGYSPYAYDDGYYPYVSSSYYYGTPAYTTRQVVTYDPYDGYYGSPYAGTQVVYRTGSPYGYYGSGYYGSSYYGSGWGYGGGFWLSGKNPKHAKVHARAHMKAHVKAHAKAGKTVKVGYSSLKKADKAR